jgi:hypothetical protein
MPNTFTMSRSGYTGWATFAVLPIIMACSPSGGGPPAGTGGSAGDGSGGTSHTATGGAPSGSGGGATASGGSGGGPTASGGSGSGGAPTASGGSGSGGAPMASGGSEASGGGPTLPPTDDYSALGPYPTTTETGVGPDQGYKVYRPSTLGEDGFLHAPIIFGPGIGQSVSVHDDMLTNFASHGFVVVGTPVLEQGPGGAENRQKLLDGLHWILEQNELPGMYQGVLWTDHAISMGFSVGGTSAVEVGGEESIVTVVSIHGHTASAELHGTMLQTTATGDGVGLPLQQNTYDASEVPTFMATLTGGSHSYIEQNGGGEERPAIVAWMRYWVYGDEGASDYFFGDDCRLCQAPWENPQRKNWP